MRLQLREQTVADYRVFPVIDVQDTSWTVTLIFVVGSSFIEAQIPQITGESISCMLRLASGATIDPVSRPPKDLLPVRGGISLQATAVFVFQTGRDEPRALLVLVNDATATFDPSDIEPSLAGFIQQPAAGASFPVKDPPRNVLDKILTAILNFLKKIGRAIKSLFNSDKCCMRSFNCPANHTHVAGSKFADFDMDAEFTSAGEDCECSCCEYRQFVRGSFRDSTGAAIPFRLEDGLLDPNEYHEDGQPDPLHPGDWLHYGHREQTFVTPRDVYNHPRRSDGCTYHGHDTPRCGPTDTLHGEFIGMIVDVCRGELREVRTWIVDL